MNRQHTVCSVYTPRPPWWRVGRSPTKERENQREDDTQDDRGRERKVEREVAAPDGEVPGQPPERDAGHHQQPQSGDAEPEEHQRLTHQHPCHTTKKLHRGEYGKRRSLIDRVQTAVSVCDSQTLRDLRGRASRPDRCRRKSSQSRKRPSPVHRIHASRYARWTARTPCAASRRRPSPGRWPPSASAIS